MVGNVTRITAWLGLAASLLGAGCSGPLAERAARPSEGILPPVLNPVTRTNESLRRLPPPAQRVPVAVYSYADQTGQFKPAETVQQLSRAVTQGATSMLIKALQDAGGGSWFMVVEREKLDNLLKERRIIADMRNLYLGERSVNPKALPPLLFAGIILEGGIIGYDSNVRTGGLGARLLGVGGDVQYREDTVTVYLRVVSTKTGEVLLTTVAHKTIITLGVRGSAFKYVALDKILEAEAGVSTNEPEQIAVQQAIEKAVHAMIVEGAARGVWSFRDRDYQDRAISALDREQELAANLARVPVAGPGAPQVKPGAVAVTPAAAVPAAAQAPALAPAPATASAPAQGLPPATVAAQKPAPSAPAAPPQPDPRAARNAAAPPAPAAPAATNPGPPSNAAVSVEDQGSTTSQGNAAAPATLGQSPWRASLMADAIRLASGGLGN